MPRSNDAANGSAPARRTAAVEVYSPRARFFHWLTVGLLLVQVPVGVYMSYRGNEMPFKNDKGEIEHGVWDALTNTLYSSHKTLGLIILAVILARLAYRLSHGAPADEPTIEPWQKLASHTTHWLLYALLIVIPVLGYVGISYYPALEVFGVKLPAITAENEDKAKAVFGIHGKLAFLLVLLAGVHIAAALYHHIIRKDNVLRRMMPGG